MKTISKLIFLVFVGILVSCEDILEEDITNAMITVNYPLNNEEIESNVVNFQWSELDGADNYRIQIFSTSQNIVVDSIVSTNYFTHSLNPGAYQWRIRGENFAYQTAYTFPINFTLVETDDLTNQIVQLISPSAGLYTQNTTPIFSWGNLNAAEYYTFELLNVTNGNEIIHQEQEISGTSFNLSPGIITQDAQYEWKIKAINSESESQYSTRTFYIDRTIPNQPQNIFPANNTIVDINEEIEFEWSVSDDPGSITSSLSYIIEISTNQNFNNLILSSSTVTTDFQYTFVSEGDYYWRVKAIDLAANSGSYSLYFKVTVE